METGDLVSNHITQGPSVDSMLVTGYAGHGGDAQLVLEGKCLLLAVPILPHST